MGNGHLFFQHFVLLVHMFLLQHQSDLPAELQTASSPPRCSRCLPAGWPSEPAHTAVSDAPHRTEKNPPKITHSEHRLYDGEESQVGDVMSNT